MKQKAAKEIVRAADDYGIEVSEDDGASTGLTPKVAVQLRGLSK